MCLGTPTPYFTIHLCITYTHVFNKDMYLFLSFKGGGVSRGMGLARKGGLRLRKRIAILYIYLNMYSVMVLMMYTAIFLFVWICVNIHPQAVSKVTPHELLHEIVSKRSILQEHIVYWPLSICCCCTVYHPPSTLSIRENRPA